MQERDWDAVDISNMQLEPLKKMLSSEDYERLRHNSPRTLTAAKRIGVKPAALVLIYHQYREQIGRAAVESVQAAVA